MTATGHVGRAVLAVLITALLAGCGLLHPPTPPEADGAGASATPSAVRTPTASPRPWTGPPVKQTLTLLPAKNGTDYGACRDGTCEVRVTKGARVRLHGRFGMDDIVVTSATSSEVWLAGWSWHGGAVRFGGASYWYTTDCRNGRCTNKVMISVTPKIYGTYNKLHVGMTVGAGHTAVLQFWH